MEPRMSATMGFKTLLSCLILSVTLGACGSVRHEIKFNDNYALQSGIPVGVGEIQNATGEIFDIDIEQMFREALTERLSKENMLSDGNDELRLVVVSKIVEYEKGDAFKRWLLPGWGSTVLSIQSDMMDGDRLVGTIEARRTVSFGGAYTVGAWRTIFGQVANDIVSDLRKQIPGDRKN